MANGLQKSPTAAGMAQLDVAVLGTFPTGRKGYILNQCPTLAVFFLLAGRDPGHPAFSANTAPARA